MKSKKRKKNKTMRNNIIVFLLLFALIFIFTIAPNYKKNDSTKTSLIINNEDVTDKLQNDIVITSEDTVYLSFQDIKKILDKNIYYNDEEKQIITTSDMHVCYSELEANTIEINGTAVDITYPLYQKGKIIYLPISELEIVYNIELKYIKDENTIIIEQLNKEKNNANVNKNISIKSKPTFFSKTVDKIKKGNSVTVIEQTQKDWVNVITDKGKIGYIKQKDLSNIYNVRQAMEKPNIEAKDYNLDNVSIETLGRLDATRNRKQWIDTEIQNILLDGKDGICFDFEKVTEYKEVYLRILIETAPRLREIGKKVTVINNKVMNTQNLLEIVDAVK